MNDHETERGFLHTHEEDMHNECIRMNERTEKSDGIKNNKVIP